MNRRSGLALLGCGALALGVGCGVDNTNPDFDGTPRVAINNLAPGVTVSGILEIETTPVLEYKTTKVELIRASDGGVVATATAEPFTLSWDTTNTADGFDAVYARATAKQGDPGQSPAVQVIVLNNGVMAAFVSGENTGDVSIPSDYDGTQEVDVLQHWNNPTSVRTIRAILSWTLAEGQEPWRIGLSVGRGICPHRGEQYGAEESSTSSPIVLEVSSAELDPPADEFLATPTPPDPATNQYFVHLRPLDAGFHVGESLSYQVDVFLLR